jgi:hypothetical protein
MQVVIENRRQARAKRSGSKGNTRRNLRTRKRVTCGGRTQKEGRADNTI